METILGLDINTSSQAARQVSETSDTIPGTVRRFGNSRKYPADAIVERITKPVLSILTKAVLVEDNLLSKDRDCQEEKGIK